MTEPLSFLASFLGLYGSSSVCVSWHVSFLPTSAALSLLAKPRKMGRTCKTVTACGITSFPECLEGALGYILNV